jgi:hypothetical protein
MLASSVKLDEISKLELKKNIDPSHFSQYFDALALAKQWLKSCCSLHTDCCASSVPKSTMPTRLLAIQGGSVRLQISSELHMNSRCATLSHCWGQVEILKLVKSNYEYLRKNIPWSRLSKTFKDAITIARVLSFSISGSIPYALCKTTSMIGNRKPPE